jgi:hypothetical protein
MRDKEKYITNEINNINVLYQNLMNFNTLIDRADINQRKYLLRTLIKNITWDGKIARIELFNGYGLQYGSDCRSNTYYNANHAPLVIKLKLGSPIDFYDAEKIAQKLISLRTDMKLSYYKLFKASGVDKGTIRKIENKQYVAPFYIKKLFSYFELDPFNQ